VEEEAGALQAHEVTASQATQAPAAKPTLSGVAVDRASRESRYLATRLAVLWQAVGEGVITLQKINTRDNPAEILTKPLLSAALRRLRALVLGLHEEAVGPGGGGGGGGGDSHGGGSGGSHGGGGRGG